MRVAIVTLWLVGATGCGGAAAPPDNPVMESGGVPSAETVGVVPSTWLPAELDSLHGEMTVEVVDQQFRGALGCDRDVCGGDVPFVMEAAPESTYSHYEFYFDVDGARPLYQVIGVPRAGWQPAPMVAVGMDRTGLSLRTGGGHRVMVQVINGRVVWTWERAQ